MRVFYITLGTNVTYNIVCELTDRWRLEFIEKIMKYRERKERLDLCSAMVLCSKWRYFERISYAVIFWFTNFRKMTFINFCKR